jgi:hypothetical protein
MHRCAFNQIYGVLMYNVSVCVSIIIVCDDVLLLPGWDVSGYMGMYDVAVCTS